MTATLALLLVLAGAVQAARVPAHRQAWQYRWWVWLPDKWVRVARCETRLRWDWDSGPYVSAFGIWRAAYQDDARHARMPGWSYDPRLRPTPWQQYQTALAHYRLHGGLSGWGCRNA